MDILISLLLFGLILGVLVLVHEAGHFLAAKAFNIKVNEFGLGLPPRLWGKKYGETVYSLNWIPFGGFVAIEGEDSPNSKSDRSFSSVNRFKRVVVLVAGVTMNFILAVIIFSVSFIQGVYVPTGHVQIGSVISGSPAESAGIKPQDVVEQVQGKSVSSFQEFQAITVQNAGHPMVIVLRRGSSDLTVSVTPRPNPPANQGSLGVVLSLEAVKKVSAWYMAPIDGTKYAFTQLQTIVSYLVTAVSSIPSGNSKIVDQVSGPVGIAYVTYRVYQIDPGYLWNLAGLISLSLALMNILPLPALDGGRILFVLLSALFRRDFYPKLESYIHRFGLAFFLVLFLFITYHDIATIFASTSLGGKVQELIKFLP